MGQNAIGQVRRSGRAPVLGGRYPTRKAIELVPSGPPATSSWWPLYCCLNRPKLVSGDQNGPQEAKNGPERPEMMPDPLGVHAHRVQGTFCDKEHTDGTFWAL